MSNPLATLRQTLNPATATRGVVVDVTGGLARVATPRGLVEVAADASIKTGEQVGLTPQAPYLTAKEPLEYWV